MSAPVVARYFGRWTRLAFGAQVVLAVLLAVGAAVLAIDLAGWRYVRLDLTESGRNTLDPAVLELVEGLPEPVTIDVFFRPLAVPYRGVSLAAQDRMLELLFVARNERRDRFRVTVHDLADLEAAQARQNELGVDGVNLIVLSCGQRRTVLRLFGDVADVDWGNPTIEGVQYLTEQGIPGVVDPRRYQPDAFRPAQLALFHGEEALAQGLLKVSSGEAPRVYLATGHGEAEAYGSRSEDLARLRAALERDGFAVEAWDATEGRAVPADCEVLGLIGAAQPFLPEEERAVRDYVDGGGRLFAAPHTLDVEEGYEHGVVSLLAHYGILAQSGVVCEDVTNVRGEKVDGLPQCSLLLVGESGFSASHPVTEPLRRHARRIQFGLSHAFGHGATPSGAVPIAIVSSSKEGWRDLPDENGVHDFAFDRREERRGRQALAMVAEFAPSLREPGEAVRRPRILAVGSSGFCGNAYFAMNRDFLLNAFNWLAERDYRVRVSPRDRSVSRLDLARGATLSGLAYALWLFLPGGAMTVGFIVAWRRRKSR